MTFLPYGRRFQRHRRMLQQYLTPNKCVGYQTIQNREARVLLQNLLEDGDNRDSFIRRYDVSFTIQTSFLNSCRFSTAIIMRVAYGHQITSDDDPYVKIAQDTGYALSNGGSPGSTPVDFFPLRKYLHLRLIVFGHLIMIVPQSSAFLPGFLERTTPALPGTISLRSMLCITIPSRKFQPKWQVSNLRLMSCNSEEILQAEGNAKSSFLSTQLEAHNRDGPNSLNTIADIKGAAGVIYCAAADTVSR